MRPSFHPVVWVFLTALAWGAVAHAEPARALPAVARRTVMLKEALQIGARQSPDIAAARAQADVVGASVRRAWGAWQPEVIATGVYDHTSAPASLDLGQFVGLVGGVYQIAPKNLSLIPAPVQIVGRNSEYGTLQLSQPLLTPQGLFLLGPARAGAEAAALGASEAREQVLLGIARTYLGLKGIAQLLDASHDAEAVAAKREKDARAQMEAGVAVEVSLLRAQAELAQARSTIAQLEGQRESLLSLLESLVGEPLQPDVTAVPDLVVGEAGDPAKAPWEQAFTVKAAAKAVEAAEGVITYDRFAWLPSVAAIAKGNYNSNSGFTGQNYSYDLILAVNVPLYDRGMRYAARHEDDAKLSQAKASFEASKARARAAWVAAVANLNASQAVLAQAEAQAQLASRAQKQVESSAEAGVVTNLELSDADQRRFLAASAAAQARAAVDIRKAELAAAEGRLYAAIE